MDETVMCRIDGAIAWLTLNRPEKLNALNYAMIDRLMALLDVLETEARMGALILTGAGERAFSAGGDIPEFAAPVALNTSVDRFAQENLARGRESADGRFRSCRTDRWPQFERSEVRT